MIVTIFAYLFFSLSSLGDKLVLISRPKPKSYTFYVGVFSAFVVLLIPFIKFGLPNAVGLMWIVLDVAVHLMGMYTMFVAIERFDVSKVIATIGATQPIFIFLLTILFWGPQAMSSIDVLAFVMLFLGSLIISVEKTSKITASYLKITMLSSAMFALDYVFSKFIFLNQPFLQGIIWMRIIFFLAVLVFLFKKSYRKEIFSKHLISDKKTQAVFLFAQGCGGIANFLQSFAIYLAPIAFLAIINSLRGIQYIFLFIIVLLASFFFPKFLREEISKKIILQKAVSIILIAAGLAILVA